MKEFDYANQTDLNEAQTFVTVNLISRGYDIQVEYKGDDSTILSLLDKDGITLHTVEGLDYTDAILTLGAYVNGVN